MDMLLDTRIQVKNNWRRAEFGAKFLECDWLLCGTIELCVDF